LGAADYAALCEQFATLMIDDVPQLNLSQLTEARRFIILIDEIYEHRVKLVCSAQVRPELLFSPDDVRQLAGATAIDMEMLSEMQSSRSAPPAHGGLSLFTGEEERFMCESNPLAVRLRAMAC
jgi:peroxisome-assembly ATPase